MKPIKLIHQQQNSKDIEGLKRISRALLKKFGGNPILKDEAILLAKKENDKRYVKYVNDIYGSNNKITYAEFVKKAIPKPGARWQLNPWEEKYQTTQRLMPNEGRNKTINTFAGSVIQEVLHRYWDKKIERNFINDFMNSDVFNGGHFEDSASFVRFTKIDDNWIHIDAIQTDFYNLVRKYGASHNLKGVQKKIVSDVLSTEMDSYKAGVSLIKKRNPKANIWTMNTAAMVKKIEHIQSEDKASALYTTLPPKLGFKLITVEQLNKIIGTRKDKKVKKPRDLKNLSFKYDFLEKIGKASKTDKKSLLLEIEKSFNEKEVKMKATIQQYALDLKSAYTVSKHTFQHRLLAILRVYYSANTEQADEMLNDIAHQVAIGIQKWKLDDDEISDLSHWILIHIKMAISTFKKVSDIENDKNEDKMNNTIWWGNRSMINEEAYTLLSMLKEER